MLLTNVFVKSANSRVTSLLLVDCNQSIYRQCIHGSPTWPYLVNGIDDTYHSMTFKGALHTFPSDTLGSWITISGGETDHLNYAKSHLPLFGQGQWWQPLLNDIQRCTAYLSIRYTRKLVTISGDERVHTNYALCLVKHRAWLVIAQDDLRLQ